jgi:AcrR family transcriptional regulator
MSDPFTPRKTARQARARDTVLGILQASAEIVVRHGFERFTTNRIAERAGVSVGSLYQYFPSKEAVFQALVEHTMNRAVDGFIAEIDAIDPEATTLESAIARLVDKVLDVQVNHGGVYAQILSSTLSMKHFAFVRKNDARVIPALTAKLRAYDVEVDDDELERGVRLALYALKGVQIGTVFGAVDPACPAIRARLARLLSAAVRASRVTVSDRVPAGHTA